MIATVHSIAEVLGELLAQYEARGLLAGGSTCGAAATPQPHRNSGAAPPWTEPLAFETALSCYGQLH